LLAGQFAVDVLGFAIMSTFVVRPEMLFREAEAGGTVGAWLLEYGAEFLL
jgi:hypothetical protein